MNPLNYFALGLFLVGSCHGIFENCDYYQELDPNKSYSIYSPEYPGKYPPGTSCRWYAVSPPNTRIFLTCDEFYIPPSSNCELDKVLISPNGRIDMNDANVYCGKRRINMMSEANKLNMVLLTVDYSPGGSFFCRIGVKENSPQPPPPPPPSPNCFCGYTNRPRMRIVGGTETGVNEYPMMAALIDGQERELFCGATIISNKYALTAAHCLVGRSPRNTGLLVGEHDISTGNETDSAKIHLIERFYIHPNYNSDNQKNDAALVRVRDRMQFSRKVGPVCLPFRNVRNSFAGETVYALGWGATSFLGPTSDKLLQVPLEVITLRQCKPSYGDRITDHQMCTFGEEKDACQTDSGGPLLWQDPETGVMKILGIISYGIHCGTNYPSVNTRVTSYLDWVKDTTGEDYCVV